ncbi:hypothetical protein DFJ74DRAFT_254635 [Hyaloraphidium curvatum]|nr:hypothetical protein DFJ74DRAFT_254635 [Hyaloraphidium curvatum]
MPANYMRPLYSNNGKGNNVVRGHIVRALSCSESCEGGVVKVDGEEGDRRRRGAPRISTRTPGPRASPRPRPATRTLPSRPAEPPPGRPRPSAPRSRPPRRQGPASASRQRGTRSARPGAGQRRGTARRAPSSARPEQVYGHDEPLTGGGAARGATHQRPAPADLDPERDPPPALRALHLDPHRRAAVVAVLALRPVGLGEPAVGGIGRAGRAGEVVVRGGRQEQRGLADKPAVLHAGEARRARAAGGGGGGHGAEWGVGGLREVPWGSRRAGRVRGVQPKCRVTLGFAPRPVRAATGGLQRTRLVCLLTEFLIWRAGRGERGKPFRRSFRMSQNAVHYGPSLIGLAVKRLATPADHSVLRHFRDYEAPAKAHLAQYSRAQADGSERRLGSH